MSLPAKDRIGEIATKGVHLGLRQVSMAPEQRIARRLAAQFAERDLADQGPRVLIQTPKDWAAHVQWDATLGHALRLRGASVEMVTCGGGLEICDRANTWEAPPMPCRSCAHYVRSSLSAHGFTQHRLSDGWMDEDGSWPELDTLSLDELWKVEAAGLPLGDIVSIPVRWFLMAADIDDDPLAPLTVRRFLRSARRIARSTVALLDRIQPDVVVVTNGLFLFEAVMIVLCSQREIDVVTYERGMIKETLVFERNGIACMFGIDDKWSEVENTPLSAAASKELDSYLDARQIGDRTIDRYWKDAEFRTPTRRRSGRMAALFSNLTWDSAVIGQAGAYESIREWILDVVDQFSRMPEHELLIRAHPAEVKLPGKQTREPIAEILREYGQVPSNVVFVGPEDPMSSYPIMEDCDVGLVFSSTTGLEMALTGTPVLVGGRTHYKGKGFTIDPVDPAEHRERLSAVLGAPESGRPDVERARRYAHLFFFGHPVAWRPVEEHVLGLARLTINDLSELDRGRDPDLDAVCDLVLGR